MRNDPKVTEAADALMRHFVNKKGKPIRTPYYSADRKFLQSMSLASITFVSNTDASH